MDNILPVDTKRYVTRPKTDLTGREFGALRVLEYSLLKDKAGNRLWRCVCGSCGEECLFSAKSLRKRKNCGCVHHSAADITNQRFGRLTALRPTEKRECNHVVWECRCDCGNVTYRAVNDLKRGKSQQHCGCMTVEIGRKAQKKALHFVDGTCIESIRSGTLFTTNTSGVRGVYFAKKPRKWCALIGFQGKQIFLGHFDTLEAAAQARKEAEETYWLPILEAYNLETVR
jgi:hypothetical protein